MKKIIYLDNAATTKPFAEIANIYTECSQEFYNASAVYNAAVNARKKLETARQNICKYLGGEQGTLIFTSCATEANNMALNIINVKSKAEIAIFEGEHPSVYNKAKQLELQGVNITYIPLKENGQIVDDIENYITPNTKFVSVMHVSNETGAINDVSKLVQKIRCINKNIIVHIDGVQAFGKIPVDLMNLDVDLYTISAHKICGPKGVGALWVKNKIKLNPLIFGGEQEFGLRSGTENVFGALALEYCAKQTTQNLQQNFVTVKNYKERFLAAIKNSGVEFKVNGDGSPYILNITFKNIRGEVLLHCLEQFNIYISTGSACSSKKPNNRTLKGMGLSAQDIMGTVRLSFSAYETFNAEEVAEVICNQVKILSGKIKGEKNE